MIRHRRGSENGYCDFGKKEIGVRPDVEGLQAVKTLLHEMAHALLHHGTVTYGRDIQELEVESAAYIVCDAIGLDSSEYSFAYVARWANGSEEMVRDVGERVIGCARTILKGLETATVALAT